MKPTTLLLPSDSKDTSEKTVKPHQFTNRSLSRETHPNIDLKMETLQTTMTNQTKSKTITVKLTICKTDQLLQEHTFGSRTMPSKETGREVLKTTKLNTDNH